MLYALETSIFLQVNHTDAGRFTVNRGIKEHGNVGDVLSFSNEEELNVWAEEPSTCNKLAGTDGSIFSTFRRPEEGVTIFSAELCRSLFLTAESKGKYNGVPITRYYTDFGDIKVRSLLIVGNRTLAWT